MICVTTPLLLHPMFKHDPVESSTFEFEPLGSTRRPQTGLVAVTSAQLSKPEPSWNGVFGPALSVFNVCNTSNALLGVDVAVFFFPPRDAVTVTPLVNVEYEIPVNVK